MTMIIISMSTLKTITTITTTITKLTMIMIISITNNTVSVMLKKDNRPRECKSIC